jgi:hypothetical protein
MKKGQKISTEEENPSQKMRRQDEENYKKKN